MRLGFFEVLLLLLVAILLPLRLWYCRSVAQTLSLTRRHHDESPELAWLLMIPLFAIGWQYHLLRVLAKGFKQSGKELGVEPGDAGFRLGLLHVLFATAAALFSAETTFPPADLVLRLASVVLWLAYWAQLASATRKLEQASVRALSAEAVVQAP
jgi:hypothetical protein